MYVYVYMILICILFQGLNIRIKYRLYRSVSENKNSQQRLSSTKLGLVGKLTN